MRRAALAAVAALLLTATPVLADPTPTPTVEPESPIRVVVTTLLPRAPKAGDAFQVEGRLVNTGSKPITGLRVGLSVGQVITTRGELKDADTDRPPTTRAETALRPLEGTLGPGQSLPFSLRTGVEALRLRSLGVYPLDVNAYGRVGDDGRQLLGLAPTWVPFFVDPPKPNKVAVLWPLVDKPRQAPDGTFLDDVLATDFRSGRLRKLLNAAAQAAVNPCDAGAVTNAGVHTPAATRCLKVPVTFAVDPDLVSAADLMASADSYDVKPLGGKRVKGTGKANATAWLADLRKQVSADSGSVLALPYGDPDVDALARTSSGREDIANAVKLGNNVVSSALSSTTIDAVWPPAGAVSERAVEALTPTSGRAAFVLDASAYPDTRDQAATSPSARTSLRGLSAGTDLTGLVAEPELSTLVTGPTVPELGSRLAEQRFIAETAIIAAEAPGTSRTFLIAPARESVVDANAAGAALRDLGKLPWLCPVRLEQLAVGSESCTATPDAAEVDKDRTSLRDDTDAELSQTYLAGVGADRDAATQLTNSVLDGDDPEVDLEISRLRTKLRQAIARAESQAWRDDPSRGREMARTLHDKVTQLTDSVSLLGGKLLLTSSKGTLQVSIANSLDLPVRVSVEFTFPASKPLETPLIAVAGKRSVPAGVKAEADRSGKFVVIAQLRDREGKPFGRATQVQVRSTRYGRLALGLTIAAAAILFIAAGYRIARRALSPPAAAE